MPACVPHGLEADAVVQLRIDGQQREEQEAREGVRGRGAGVHARARRLVI